MEGSAGGSSAIGHGGGKIKKMHGVKLMGNVKRLVCRQKATSGDWAVSGLLKKLQTVTLKGPKG